MTVLREAGLGTHADVQGTDEAGLRSGNSKQINGETAAERKLRQIGRERVEFGGGGGLLQAK